MTEQYLEEKQFFYAAEFEPAAAWLIHMHREGWRLVSTTGRRYRFEACPGEAWVYHLDFKEEPTADPDYLQMYRDYGWEYVTQHRHWFYFRKKADGEGPEDLSIFNDDWSKMEMIERVIRDKVQRGIPLLVLLLALQFVIWGTPLLAGAGIVFRILQSAAVLTAAAVVFGFGIYIGQLDRLQKLRTRLDQKR